MNNSEDEIAQAANPRNERNLALRREYLRLDELEKAYREAGEHRKADLIADKKRNDILGTFCDENQGLARSYAKVFIRGADPNKEDYIHDGIHGLIEAFTKWDPDHGATFATFSRFFISGKVQRGVSLVEHDQLSHSDFGAIKHVGTIASVLTEKLGRAPSNKEVSEYSRSDEWLKDEEGKEIKGHQSYTPALVDRVRKGKPVSLETPINEGGGTVADMVADRTASEALDLDEDAWWEHVRNVTADLRPDELFVLTRREGLDMAWNQSLVEVSSLTGEGRGTVSRKENSAREKVSGPIPMPLI